MNKAGWVAGKYGIMVHYLPESAPKSGEKQTDYNVMANEFDIAGFVKQAKEMGAKWVIFPFGQNSGFYWSPNSVIEQYCPNCCSNRDLVMELASALKKEDMRFIAYIPTEMDSQVPKLRDAFGWDAGADKKAFMDKYSKVLREYGERFGTLMDGWWFDGCYDAEDKKWLRTRDWSNKRFEKKDWIDTVKAGSPDRIFAMCTGANKMEYVFEEEEYLAGESSGDREPWEYQEDKKQWHCLFWLDCPWVHTRVGEMEPPKFSDEYLIGYVKRCLAAKGAVTMNIGIYEDGTLSERTVAQIKKVKAAMEQAQK